MKIKYGSLQYLTLLIYLCVLSANQTVSGIDQALQWISFFAFVGASLLTHLRNGFYITGISKWYLFFMVFSLSSCLWALYSRSEVFFYQNRMIQLLAMTVCIPLNIKSDNDIERCLNIVLVALSYAAILLLIRTPFSAWGTERMGAAVGLDANVLGTRMAVGLLISLYFLSQKKQKKYIVLIIVMGLLTLLSGSKKALIMIIMGICLMEYFNSKSERISKILGHVIITIIALCIGWYLIFNVEIFYSVLGTRIERTVNYILSGGTTFDNSTRERQYYISIAKELFKQNPILGVGLNNFRAYIGRIGYSHVAYSHNNYWELLSCLGIVGTFIFYSMHLYLGMKSWKLLQNRSNPLTVLMTVLLILYVVCDYGAVTYMNIFQYIIITFAYLHIKNQDRMEN